MSFAAAGPGGKRRRLPGEVVRRRAFGVGPVGRGDDEVAVLDARDGTARRRDRRPARRRAPRRSGGSARSRDGRRRSRPSCRRPERDQVAAVRDLVGRELDAHRRGLDRRPAGVELERVVAEDRQVPDVAAGRQPAGDHLGPADLAALRERGRFGSAAASSGVFPSSASTGSSAQPSGTRTTYFTNPRVRDGDCAARLGTVGGCIDTSSPRSPPSSCSGWSRPAAPAGTTTRARPSARRHRPRPSSTADARRRPPRRPTSPRSTSSSPRSPSSKRPTAMTLRPDDPTLYVTEKAGRIRAIRNGQLDPTPVLDITSMVNSSGNEQGLLGLAFSPDGTKLYVHYSNRNGDTRVDEYAVDAAGAVNPSSRREVLAVDQPQANHNGGELAFGPDGMLYLGLGDGGGAGDQGSGPRLRRQRSVAGHAARQDPAHRPDARAREAYTIPPDNPFVEHRGRAPEIWAYGLRNPWRFSWDKDDRRPLDRRRRPGRVGRGRPRDQGLRRRPRGQLRVERVRGHAPVPRRRRARGGPTGLRATPTTTGTAR